MPSATEKQRNYIFYLRSKYKNKSDTPEKQKWIWDSGWEQVKEDNITDDERPIYNYEPKVESMELIEQEAQEINPKVQEILGILRDNKFGNESSRKHFLELITSLHNTNDKVARILFRKLGDYCTTLVPQILDESTEELKVYKRKFK